MSRPMTILIVDDHPAMCQTLQDILETEGYIVRGTQWARSHCNLSSAAL